MQMLAGLASVHWKAYNGTGLNFTRSLSNWSADMVLRDIAAKESVVQTPLRNQFVATIVSVE